MARNYPNIIDYAENELESFEQRELCRVDSLVFSWLAYFRFPPQAEGIRDMRGQKLKDLYRTDWFDAMCGKLYDTPSSLRLLAAVAASPRFREVRVCEYVVHTNEVAEQQFSACTFCLSPEMTYVAFRGTDNTLVGWKEDFNMAFAATVPSQVAAREYLEHVAGMTSGKLWCGGHSKGGNVAVYAAMMSEPSVSRRLVRCFSHDGPGFSDQTMADPRWDGTAGLVDKTIPQSSLIGMVFERQERDYLVVHSHNVGFTQHDPFSWEVEGCDFVLDDKIGQGANLFNASLNSWLASTTAAERERFVDTVFGVIAASGFSTMGDIRRGWRTALPAMLAAVSELPEEDRRLVSDALISMLRALGRESSQAMLPRTTG